MYEDERYKNNNIARGFKEYDPKKQRAKGEGRRRKTEEYLRLESIRDYLMESGPEPKLEKSLEWKFYEVEGSANGAIRDLALGKKDRSLPSLPPNVYWRGRVEPFTHDDGRVGWMAFAFISRTQAKKEDFR